MGAFTKTLTYQWSLFYTDGRRLLGLSGARIDALIQAGATAHLQGATVTITAPGTGVFEWTDIAAPRQASTWVRKFNARARSHRTAHG